MGIKGQKINPVGWRVGFYRKWKTAWFQESWNYGLMLHKTLKIQKIIESFLLYKKFIALSSNIYCLNDNTDNFYIFIFFYNLRLNKKQKQRNNTKFFNNYLTKKNVKINTTIKKLKKYNNNSNFWKIAFNNKINKLKTNSNKISTSNFIKNNIKNKYPNWLLNYKQQFKKRRKKKNSSFLNKKLVLSHCLSHNWNNKNFVNYSLKNNFINNKIFKSNLFFNIKSIKNNFILLFNLLNSSRLKFILAFLYEINKNNIKYNNQLNLYYSFIKKYFLINNFSNLSTLLEWQNIYLFKNVNNYYFTNNIYLENNSKINKINDNLLISTALNNNNKSSNSKSLSKLFKINTNKNKSNSKLELYFNKKYIKKRKKFSYKLKKKVRSVFIKPFFVYWGRRVKYFLKNLENLFGKNAKLFYSRLWKRLYFNIFKESGKKQIILNKHIKKRKSRWYLYKHIRSTFFLSHKLMKLKKDKQGLTDVIKNKTINNSNTYTFSLLDLTWIFQLILGKNVKFYFINSLKFLIFQSTFLNNNLNPILQSGKTSLNLFLKKFRFKKLNLIRNYQKLLKLPSKLSRQGKQWTNFVTDLILLSLISFLTRNFKLLLKFISIQVYYLHKSKRQIPFLRFIMRLLISVGTNIIRIKSVRIQFKGRFDRWNRSKSLLLTKGNIPFQQKNVNIEFASTHGLINKGTYGIRLWVWYGNYYSKYYHQLFKTYWYNYLHLINK